MADHPSMFEIISSQYFQLTNSEKRVADYILGHRSEVQYLSLSELASECGVADATISRFCRRLGSSGYNAFKLELVKAAMAPRGSASASKTDDAGNIYADLYKKIIDEHIAALEQTAGLLGPEQVRQASDLIQNASRVVCMGQGTSMVMAQEAWTMFSSISPKFLFVSDPHLQITTLALMNPEDVVLFFSYSGSTRDFRDIMEVARTRRVNVILVTRFANSPAGQKADVVLQCGANEIPLQQGSAAARTAQLFVLDVLFRQMCEANKKQVNACKERIAEAVTRKHL